VPHGSSDLHDRLAHTTGDWRGDVALLGAPYRHGQVNMNEFMSSSD
jgi:hypothetical protein